MTENEFSRRLKIMSDDQDRAAKLVLPQLGADLIAQTKLCGGTALSRFYLHHRISYDLDFFIPENIEFNAESLAAAISSKVKIQGLELTHDPVKADQIHFFVPLDGADPIKMSFVEDMYSSVYPFAPLSQPMVDNVQLRTESIEGLYHRKLRTVVGWANNDAQTPSGGRQTARDMFDLYVLSQAVMPLKSFIESLPYAFPLEAFIDGMASMPWFEMAEELSQTISAPSWQSGLNVSEVKNHLFKDLDIIEISEEFDEESDGSPNFRSRED